MGVYGHGRTRISRTYMLIPARFSGFARGAVVTVKFRESRLS